ncbi:polysaccharide deacetylase [Salibacterium salarium]|uniref:Polysaccharide deacetylase n=1 Tax=Salibacterium salarium TaxID=284579 RepID=A0A3R9P5D6_9BACI|nr:polysaccharide deacetylase family protein [Salibacterium salarium]RSL30708.1 polysaccharide deacetylase [Salibacterium salarium]
MKMIRRPISCLPILLIIMVLVSTNTQSVYGQDSTLSKVPIFIDEEPVKTKYIMREGHLLVPALFLKHTGTLVDWNDQYNSVVFQSEDNKIALPVHKNVTQEYDRATDTWEKGSLSTKTVKFEGNPFVPLVDVVKKLGMDVTYNSKRNRTFITTNISIEPESKAYTSINTSEKLVALTFDDGPENHYTPMILDILNEKEVPATFFSLGSQITHFPEMIQRIAEEGHGIGNHSWSHPDLSNTWSSKVKEEIHSTQEEMQKVIGKKPDLFRPPYGVVTKADKRVLNNMGMRNINWSVDTQDWSGLSANEIVETVQRDISPGGIILQHNFQSDDDAKLLDGSVEALPKIIDDLQERGYTFVTVQTLLEQHSKQGQS